MTQQQTAGANTKAPGAIPLNDEERSKDKFFAETAALANAMITAHGREFAMGTLILAARFIAENKAFTNSENTQNSGANAACGCGSSHDHDHDHAHHHPKT